MSIKKKILLGLLSLLGALFVVNQAVWASNDSNQNVVQPQVSQMDMKDMVKMTNSGNMDEMMNMMQTPEGKQMMEKCLEMLPVTSTVQ